MQSESKGLKKFWRETGKLLQKFLLFIRFPVATIAAARKKPAQENTWGQSYKYTAEMTARIKRMLTLIQDRDVHSLMDIGCGRQECGKMLDKTITYYPVDQHQHLPTTVVKDLNAGEFLEIPVDVVFCSGVLEYIYDLDSLLEKIRCYGNSVLCSYRNTDTHPWRHPIWVNHLSHSDFLQMWEKHGFTLTQEMPPSKGCSDHIYYFEKQIQ